MKKRKKMIWQVGPEGSRLRVDSTSGRSYSISLKDLEGRRIYISAATVM